MSYTKMIPCNNIVDNGLNYTYTVNIVHIILVHTYKECSVYIYLASFPPPRRPPPSLLAYSLSTSVPPSLSPSLTSPLFPSLLFSLAPHPLSALSLSHTYHCSSIIGCSDCMESLLSSRIPNTYRVEIHVCVCVLHVY